MSSYAFAAGFSVHPEIVVVYPDGFHESSVNKVSAKDLSFRLGGTSANLAHAMKSLGHEGLLLVASGVNPTDMRTYLLERLLADSGLRYSMLPVREETSVSMIPINGIRNHVVTSKRPLLAEAVPAIAEQVRATRSEIGWKWRIVTSCLPTEILLAEALLGENKGNRILNPRAELMEDKDTTHRLLQRTDILVCNEHEFLTYFDATREEIQGSQFAAIHNLGVTMIAVTRDSRGSLISWHGDVFEFPAPQLVPFVHEVGAGDWWLGGFLSSLIDQQVYTVFDLKQQAIEWAGVSASVTAALKVGQYGGGSGPSKVAVQTTLAVIAATTRAG
ncbi:MAG: carbohydrate kinase family protein [Candidatus Doudnabacteria bacterium]|nr:carbohydrate kinase family protein [Candidatus Doudnabacteria bacterium]